MTEKETKAKAAPKKAAAPAKAKPAAKPAAAKAAPKAAAPKKAATPEVSAGNLRVTQVVGSIARRHDQRATLIGLGLNKRHRTKVLADTPSIRGMINKVKHLLKVEQA